jgi:nicotinate dehydrogenase subunit A
MPDDEVFSIEVNGRPHRLALPANTMLLDVLRTDLGLLGTRFGCGEGQCGACTALLDGNPVQTCTTPLWSVAGRRVTTVEGLCDAAGAPGPVQAAFLAEQAAQCGYCTSGIVMTVAGLLGRSPRAGRAEILAALDKRHLCRCGAHPRILRAVDRAIAAAGAPA